MKQEVTRKSKLHNINANNVHSAMHIRLSACMHTASVCSGMNWYASVVAVIRDPSIVLICQLIIMSHFIQIQYNNSWTVV